MEHKSIIDDWEYTLYNNFVKRLIDIIFSIIGIAILALPMLLIVIIIKLDDPGPALFVQDRVGTNKKIFKLYKFRSMKMSAPHNMPTHMLENPDQYITRCGKILRKLSLDELPQVFNIFMGHMSIVGPRPALWNQYDLIEERDKYNANDVRPGLTGWAQINGRDTLEIPEKAKLDGDYVKQLNKGFFSGFVMDCKCFFGSFISVVKSDGVVEGGTGEIKKDDNDHT